MTPGEMLFYGGIAGMCIIALAAIIAIIVLSRSRKTLRKKLDAEYGSGE